MRDVREIIGRAIHKHENQAGWLMDDHPNKPNETLDEYLEKLWDLDDIWREDHMRCANDVLSALADAGYVVVEREPEYGVFVSAGFDCGDGEVLGAMGPTVVKTAWDRMIRAAQEKTNG